MISSNKIKSVDFYRKIPRDLTEASLSGAGLSILAALAMVFLFGMELHDYLKVSTDTAVIVDKSGDGEFLRIDFNISFPALSCEFASVDVSDVLGTKRLNITKTVRKFSIDPGLNPTGEFHSGPIPRLTNHGDEADQEYVEGAVPMTSRTFDRYVQQYPILAVNFYAPWCYWSNRLKPAWEKASKIIRERYDPEMDGRILLAKVDCTEHGDLCRRHHIQGYPSIRIFRKGSDIRDAKGNHFHESYYGERDTDSLVVTMEALVAPVTLELPLHQNTSEEVTDPAKRPAPLSGGCRVEGFVRVKKVPGNLLVSARSAAHSFDASQINVSHVISHFSFGRKLSQRMLTEVRRLMPDLSENADRLTGRPYVIHHLDANANVTIEHYLQIVKTEVSSTRTLAELKLQEYEYTAHSSLVQSVDIPAVKFHFELAPMQVLITESQKSFSHFITNVCAIIGGVFTVAGIMESILSNTMRLVKKVELGKQF